MSDSLNRLNVRSERHEARLDRIEELVNALDKANDAMDRRLAALEKLMPILPSEPPPLRPAPTAPEDAPEIRHLGGPWFRIFRGDVPLTDKMLGRERAELVLQTLHGTSHGPPSLPA